MPNETRPQAGLEGRRHPVEQRADALAQAGDYEAAEATYLQAAALDPRRARPHLGLGTLYLQTDRLDQAWRAFHRARRAQPDSAEAYGGLAMVHQHRQEYPQAFNLYLKCLELDTDNLVALLGLFQTSCQMGTFTMITQYLERYLRMHPHDTSVLFCLATLYAREGKLAEARDALTDLLRLQPEKAEAGRLLAAVEARLAQPVAGVQPA